MAAAAQATRGCGTGRAQLFNAQLRIQGYPHHPTPHPQPPPTGPYRARFLTEAVADLRQRLRAAGSELVVRQGRPEEVIAELVRRTGAGAVYCHSEVGLGNAG